MNIQGYNKTTLLDYPGHVAATIFLGGCNFRCPFCHNGGLVTDPNGQTQISEDELISFLQKRKTVLSGVCVTGGEPTLYEDLPELLFKIKAEGYLIKLDTNGTNPEMLKRLYRDKLIDYVAMDIKSSPDKYEILCGTACDIEKIEESIRFLMHSGVDYEFRTTVVRELHSKEDLLNAGKWIAGAKRYFLQSYQESEQNLSHGFHAFEKEELMEVVKQLEKEIPCVSLRGIE